MAINILQPIQFNVANADFVRSFVENVSDLKDLPLRKYPQIYEVLVKEDGCKYRLNKANDDDPTLGKWRKVDLDPDHLPSGGSTTLGENITINKEIGALPAASTIPSAATWQQCIKLLLTGSAN